MAKPVLRSGYTFTPASKQISFAGVVGFNINGLLAIFNRTAGVMIFDATEPTLDFASVSGSTVTLKYDTTSGMSSTDVLTIIYDEQAQDGLTTTLSLNANGNQPGIPTAGYGTILVELTGTFNLTVTAQFSTDSTNGIDGTWPTTASGWVPEDTGTGSAPATIINSGVRKRQYRATDGLWFRLVVSGYVSGTAVATITRRVCGIAERAVTVSNAVSLSAGGSTIGGTYGVAVANVSPGTIPFRIKSTAGANTGLIFNSISNFCGGLVSNSGATAAFLKLYNKASAPVLSSDTPALTIMIPPGSTLNLDRTVARRFLSGLAYAITGGKADNDTTAVGADDIQGELIYA